MVKTRIENASENDIRAILKLSYELGRPKPRCDSDVGDFEELVKKYLSDPDKQIAVAKASDGAVVGMASMLLLPRLNHRNPELYIAELAVLEEYQNHGIGRKLIDYCVSLGKRHGCHRIRLESGNQRKNSHQFYKHLGFVQNSLSFTMPTI